MNNKYFEYDVDYISGFMSLRPPQKRSLNILADILDEVPLKKDTDLNGALQTVHNIRPTCSSFERSFVSMSFALATGVGKTRLMGAFIAYLYTVKGIKNFFVVAPNITIYEKLKSEISDINHKKYMFKGIGCFATVPPNVITGENYEKVGYTYGFSDCNINIFNISKFNKELGNIKKLSEYIGESYFKYLSAQEDLCILMDESHHYRAAKGFAAINELNPVLGLELTATPQVEMGTRTVKFKNVVYEYPLSQAIADGYAKLPAAMSRRDIADLHFSDDDMDKMMLNDGMLNHERVRAHLAEYANNTGKDKVKPFVLVVCKDTTHAEKVLKYINSNEFFGGKYRGKAIEIHSNQSGVEKEENIRLLLDVEKYDNPVEIVIHVNILKEGWDVNNLYTIIPLRTAASKTLREQTIGRGLRLPYGERTGNKVVDTLVITAHDKFDEIIKEANDPNSLLRVGNIIFAEDIEPTDTVIAKPVTEEKVQLRIEELFTDMDEIAELSLDEREAISAGVKQISVELSSAFKRIGTDTRTKQDIIKSVVDKIDLGEIVKKRTDYFDIERRFIAQEVEKQYQIVEKGTMAIPMIEIARDNKPNYHFDEFELDTSEMNYMPVTNELQLQDLISQEIEIIKEQGLSFQADDPMKVLLLELSSKPEVDYEEYSDLLYSLITAAIDHIKQSYDYATVKNIVMFYKYDIANRIYAQMKEHFVCSTPTLLETVVGMSNHILNPGYTVPKGEAPVTLYDNIDEGRVTKYLFVGFKKALHLQYKFDSMPEKRFAVVCESSPEVEKWLRPHPNQFNLFWGGNHRYEPDFVVETKDCMYLVEIKGEDKLNDPAVLQKKARAVRYCEVANVYCEANNLKPWKHLFIPSKQVTTTTSFSSLTRFEVK